MTFMSERIDHVVIRAPRPNLAMLRFYEQASAVQVERRLDRISSVGSMPRRASLARPGGADRRNSARPTWIIFAFARTVSTADRHRHAACAPSPTRRRQRLERYSAEGTFLRSISTSRYEIRLELKGPPGSELDSSALALVALQMMC